MPRSTNVRVRFAPQRRHTWSGDIPPSSLLPRKAPRRSCATSRQSLPARGSICTHKEDAQGRHKVDVGCLEGMRISRVGREEYVMGEPACRACRGRTGHMVLDLGEQPACDYFPRSDDPGPDPVYPLQMWLCSSCGLAQLLADPTMPEEPKGTEPAALVAQAVDAVDRVDRAGLLPESGAVAEYGSPHGGSWLGLLADRGLVPADRGPADVIIDCFGFMHAADQQRALAERVARV